MPRVFDNIDASLLPALQDAIGLSERGDFCVGYFNLRGWKKIAPQVEAWPGGAGHCCRVLVGMQRLPSESLRSVLAVAGDDDGIDNQTALQLRQRLAEEFRRQLTVGFPTNEDEAALRQLAAQIKSDKVRVKLYLRHPLHAKLYLLFRQDVVNPVVGYLGSSNLTLAGLARQGELNVDVMDHDACQKLAKWFEERWEDQWCVDISDELVHIIEGSWAREDLVSPYHIYLKMAYHLSQEARSGLAEFRIPRDFGDRLFEFQKAAVKIAAHHLNTRQGVLVGDVTGLGKTLMATALARIFEDDFGLSTLIICPKNLVGMWQDYARRYRMHGPMVLSSSRVINELPDLRRYRLVIIDESHNLRNREGKRYRAIQEYIRENESRCILLSATPYNKTYLDLSNQLRLFVGEEEDLGIRPENLLREIGEVEFMRRHQCPFRSLSAFEHTEYADDWRELMRRYLVRRTRSFVKENYAKDDGNGRKCLVMEDGRRSYFPERIPCTAKFKVDREDPDDQYAQLFSARIVDAVNGLSLPRYGLGNYVAPSPDKPPAPEETRVLQNLSRAGKRLMGFCRTNLFKRLESCGYAFLQSVARHVLRNHVVLYALKTGQPVPIGTQDAVFLDPGRYDEDREVGKGDLFGEDEGDDGGATTNDFPRTWEEYQRQAAATYQSYRADYRGRFDWLRADLFVERLADDLREDARTLFGIIEKHGDWRPGDDTKLNALHNLLAKRHGNDKVLVFTQFADTVDYLAGHLEARGVRQLAGVTGDSADPTALAYRFSPESNEKAFPPEDQLRVLVATDVLSEGQNLQDCAIVVNFDLPWALVRLVQRVGRVDRIGQDAGNILCYSFMPADGVEDILHLRSRVRTRLQENAEVVGSDEEFFEGGESNQRVVDLYNEKSSILDDDPDSEVDLASRAYQIWHNAVEGNPELEKAITDLSSVVYSNKAHEPAEGAPNGVLVYMRTPEGTDALSWIDREGNSVSESQFQILQAAACTSDTPALPRTEDHHRLVRKAVRSVAKEERSAGGQLGRPSGARFRTYERLKRYLNEVQDTLFEPSNLKKVLDHIYQCPLRQVATDTLNRQLRAGVSDDDLARLVIDLHEEDRLCLVHEEEDEVREPQIICSMGLRAEGRGR